MHKSNSRFWAFNAITLGAWEALGVIGVLPTISETIQAARERSKLITGIALASWELGLYHYLMTRR